MKLKYGIALLFVFLAFNLKAFQNQQVDSLLNEIKVLQEEIKALKSDPLVLDYRIEEFIPAFLEAWENLDEGEDGSELLAFFSQNFFVNGVNVDQDNKPEIVIAEGPVFKKRLQAYVKSDKFDVNFSEPKYLYAVLKKDIFYVVFEVSAAEEHPEGNFNAKMVMSMVGRVNKGELKIGNFNYFELAEQQ